MPWRRSAPRTASAVVNTLDRAHMVGAAIESLLAQTFARLQVVVVNGPSDDGTAEVLRSFGRDIDIVRCDVRSLGVSRNLGVEAARGDVVLFLDDDATAPPSWVEQLVASFDAPDVGGAGGPVFDVPLQRIEWKVCSSTRLGDATTDSACAVESLVHPGADPFLYFAGCNMGFRRSALVAVGGFNEALAYGYDDVEVCRVLIDAGFRLRYVEDAVVTHHRAASAVRDDRQVVLDPYPLVFARAVFAAQASTPGASDVRDAVERYARGWCDAAAEQLRDQLLTPDQCDRCCRRALEGAQDGLETGARPRAATLLRPRRSWRGDVRRVRTEGSGAR